MRKVFTPVIMCLHNTANVKHLGKCFKAKLQKSVGGRGKNKKKNRFLSKQHKEETEQSPPGVSCY